MSTTLATDQFDHPPEHLDHRQHVGGEGITARSALDRLAHGPRNPLPDRRIPEDRAAPRERPWACSGAEMAVVGDEGNAGMEKLKAAGVVGIRRRAARPSWSHPSEAVRLFFRGATVRTAWKVAVVVGTVLSAVNQGAVIAGGDATWATWVRVGVNYLVPFLVASVGFLSACREP
jgi:hypothetical protein